MTTVTWVLDANSKHEISSKDHLVQLMNNGLLYTNAGSVPSGFMAADYVQTVDIDLLGDSTDIVPIGTDSVFQGDYDGNAFTISNWSYVDPNYGTADAYVTNAGLFGNVNGATLKNIRVAGVCTLSGFGERAGIFAGNLDNTTAYNIECDLSAGSSIQQGDNTSGIWAYMSGLIGGNAGGSATALTFRGQLDSIVPSVNVERPVVGGLIAFANQTNLTLLRNLGVFPGGLNGYYAGGVVAYLFWSTFVKGMNAMQGDITSTKQCGGVIGYLRQSNSSQTSTEYVNSMKGDIRTVNPGGQYPAGVVGWLGQQAGSTIHTFMNYMTGDIVATQNSIWAAGIIGLSDASANITTSINAMNGTVYNSVMSSAVSVPDLATVDTSFGLAFTVDNYNTNAAVTGLPIDTDTNLPYFLLTATDGDGVLHDWDFIFGNPTTLSFIPRPVNVQITYGAKTGAVAYRMTVQEAGDASNTVRTVKTGFTDLAINVKSLSPETEYVFSLYSTADGSQYELYLQDNESTLVNLAANYDISDYGDGTGGYDLSDDSLSEFLNDLFTTGDSLVVSIGNGVTKKTTFVKIGGSSAIADTDALLLPFDVNSGASQSVSITLSDSSSVTLAFDEVNETLNFGGTVYSPGESVVVDGRKLTFTDI